jgi:hypothetical protein
MCRRSGTRQTRSTITDRPATATHTHASTPGLPRRLLPRPAEPRRCSATPPPPLGRRAPPRHATPPLLPRPAAPHSRSLPPRGLLPQAAMRLQPRLTAAPHSRSPPPRVHVPRPGPSGLRRGCYRLGVSVRLRGHAVRGAASPSPPPGRRAPPRLRHG